MFISRQSITTLVEGSSFLERNYLEGIHLICNYDESQQSYGGSQASYDEIQQSYGDSQASYDESQQSYGSSAKGGGIPPYGAQGPTELPPPTSQVASVQPLTSAGIGTQQLNTPLSYPQGSVQTSYGSQPAPPPIAQAGYGPPQGHKAAYGQTPPPSSTQTGRIQSAPMQPGYALPPTQSGYAHQDSAQYHIPSTFECISIKMF